MKSEAEAMRDLGRVVGEAAAELATMTAREAAERAWNPGVPSIDELTARAEASGRCRRV